MKSGSMFTILIGVIIMAILLPALGKGDMSSGVYIALVTAVFGLVQSMSWQLSGMMHDLAHLKEYLKELNDFLGMEEKNEACAEPFREEDFRFHSLEFRNVSFQYPGTDTYVLKNCSFQMLQGKTYAFVGRNGAETISIICAMIFGLFPMICCFFYLNKGDRMFSS